MRWNERRVALLVVDAFAAASALAGGVAVMAGVIQFPAGWLAGSGWTWLVSDYFIAGAILLLVVGGSSVVAAIATATAGVAGPGLSAGAGLVMIGWILGEVVILSQYTWLQVLYGLVGLAMVALSLTLGPVPLRSRARGERLT